jgi:hypothetical protein
MASAANLAWPRQTGRRYIIGAPKSELKKFSSELAAAAGWRAVHDGVEVKLARHLETDETVILCRSADRRSKEHAMHDKFSRRIEAALGRLAARIARSKKRLDPATVNRQIGRILQQNQRAAARFAVELAPDSSPAGVHLAVACNTAFDDWAALSEGAYLLRSNITDWSDQQLWKACIQLTQAEAAVAHPERSVERASDLAPARGPRSGSYPRMLPRLRAVEEPRDVAEPRRPRKLPSLRAQRARTNSIARRRAADSNPWSDSSALRHSTRRLSGCASRSPWRRPTQTHAPRRAPYPSGSAFNYPHFRPFEGRVPSAKS